MRLLVTAAMVTLLASCDGPPPIEHASSDFVTAVGGQEYILPYEGTHDVMRDRDREVRLLVLVHHDGRVNPVGSFDYMMAALDSAAAHRPELRLPGTTMVLSPAMIYEQHVIDRPERYADGHYPWWLGGWRQGRRADRPFRRWAAGEPLCNRHHRL